jgi:NAD+ synthase
MITTQHSFSANSLKLDCAQEAGRIAAAMREQVLRRFRKKGVVVALSGGIDSSTVAALAVRALGAERVLGLLMPERDSSSDTLPLSQQLAKHLGIETVQENITGMLEAVGCYRRRDDAIRLVLPQYGAGWKSKIVLPNVFDEGQFRLFSIVVQSAAGQQTEVRLTMEAYLGIVAATNFKQRTRKMLEYYHADRLNFAVTGTPNRLEYDQGFFVKLGDGAADIKPIAHLYKTQVYAMARFLQLPEEICSRQPTTDTYSLPQSQEEFYFSVPYDKMDLILCGKNQGLAPAEVGPAVGLTAEQVAQVFRDIESKRRVAQYLHAPPVLMEDNPSEVPPEPFVTPAPGPATRTPEPVIQ